MSEVQAEFIHRLPLAYLVYCQRCCRVLNVFDGLGSVPYSVSCQGCGAVSKARLCHRSHPKKRIVVLSLHNHLGIEIWRGLPEKEREKWLSLLK
jgi:hypothetical protein